MNRRREWVYACVLSATAFGGAVGLLGGATAGPAVAIQGARSTWMIAAMYAVALWATDVIPLYRQARRTTFTYPGYELVVLAVAVLPAGQALAATSLAAASASASVGRVPLVENRTPLTLRRGMARTANIVLGVQAALVVLAVTSGHLPRPLQLLAGVGLFVLLQSGLGLLHVTFVAGHLPGVRTEVRAGLVHIARTVVVLAPLGVLVGMLLTRGSSTDAIWSLAVVTACYVLTARTLEARTARHQRHAALLAATRDMHDCATSALAAEQLRRHAREALGFEDLQLVDHPVVGAYVQSPVGQVGERSWWLVVPAGPATGLDRASGQRELLDALASIGGALWRNAHLREQLATQAALDELTGLWNRRALAAQYERMVAEACRSGTTLAVIYVDMDDFRRVNNEHGHDAGDQVLAEVADRLGDRVRASDVVARVGGDEFVVVAGSLDDTDAAEQACARVRRAFDVPLDTARGLDVGASVGMAIYGRDGTTRDELLEHADQHMFVDKHVRKAAGGALRP